MKTTKTRTDLHAEITARIVEEMRKGATFQDVVTRAATEIKNYVSHRTGENYSLLNSLMLMLSGKRAGEFATFKQIKEAGGSVKPGAKAAPIYFYAFIEKELKDESGNPMTDEHGNAITDCFPILKKYYVFNVAEDATGITPKHTTEKESGTPEQTPETGMLRAKEIADMYLQPGNDFGPALTIRAVDNAFYETEPDRITMPDPSQYTEEAFWWGDLFHEMAHSTGHPDRLKRPYLTGKAASGAEEHSREELIAEIAAAYLCGHAGIRTNNTTKQSAGYISGWIKHLTDHPREFSAACNAAEKAANYILD